MNKKRVLLASTMAILIAPTVLETISNQVTVQAAPTNISENTINNPIGTVDYGGADAIDSNGNKTGLFLSGKSSWKLGASVLINNQRCYAIGVNTYVNSQNITITDGMPPVNPFLVKDTDNNQTGTLGYAVKVVDMHGNPTGVVLPAGSSWKLGNLYSINGKTYYQVATNEYVESTVVKVNDVPATAPSTSGNMTPENRTIALSNDSQVLDDNGNPTGKTLPKDSFWHTDQSKSINNYRYYRVATNAWVSMGGASSATIFGNGPISITLTTDTTLYDSSTNTFTRSLPAGSSWKAYSAVKNQNNEIYVKVSSNEWLRLTEKNQSGGAYTMEQIATYGASSEPDFATHYAPAVALTATLKNNQSVYDTSSNSLTRALPASSSWKITKVVRNQKNEFWGRVSTNEWLLIDASNLNMSYGDSDTVPNVAISEPTFATNITK
ncbi:SLAP domain-containing protein [Companilactobacillus kimchiensis]|uniref:Teichoic acid-binding N-acetylmuramoyl L-alalanine amidase n=1 Tax=Companilactobacillus kimchiensis TaxID=993692 RepID=A0A0R2LGS2_9LACO|nr:SLAP domain-containing protein [Companilactobacillus kimchiensis]KRO00758.1 teichoic acid-binding N-acetylmuramoyl L-alalanine amidase [Companilactobacillus kimchiensis]